MSDKTVLRLHTLMLLALAVLLYLVVRETQRQLAGLQEEINRRGPFMDVPPVPVAETAPAAPEPAAAEPARPKRTRKPKEPQA